MLVRDEGLQVAESVCVRCDLFERLALLVGPFTEGATIEARGVGVGVSQQVQVIADFDGTYLVIVHADMGLYRLSPGT